MINYKDKDFQEFAVEFFKWYKTEEAKKLGAHKNDLIKYIAEKKGIKESSVRRNLNRMENYYLKTGKQARSGKEYWNLIAEFYKAIEEDIRIASNDDCIGWFMTYKSYDEYAGELKDILVALPDFNEKALIVYRIYPTK